MTMVLIIHSKSFIASVGVTLFKFCAVQKGRPSYEGGSGCRVKFFIYDYQTRVMYIYFKNAQWF